jgi:SpoVK/Ycf46/Vps4 family AAA+-type ATPase
MESHIKVYIPHGEFQDSLIEYATYVLYKMKQIKNTDDNPSITSFELSDYLFKKENKESKLLSYDYFSPYLTNDDEADGKCGKNSRKLQKLEASQVAFQITEGLYSVPIENAESSSIELLYEYSPEIHRANVLTPYKKVYLTGKKSDIQLFIANMSAYFNKNNDVYEYFKVFIPSPKGHWDLISKNKKRSIDTVFIKNKDEIIKDIDEFLSSEEDYQIFGHPYKRNYLFFGPPGNGKTSLISAIASQYNLDIYLMSFSVNITDEIFKKLISSLPINGLLVFEDIDGLFDEKEKKQISISTVLNIMDGLAKKNRLMTIMTTNHYNRLSDAFKRAGRVDMSVEFDIASIDSFNQIIRFFCKYKNVDMSQEYGAIVEEFYNGIKYLAPSCALVQKFIFENRKAEIKDLFSRKMILKFKELHSLYKEDRMCGSGRESKRGISLYA